MTEPRLSPEAQADLDEARRRVNRTKDNGEVKIEPEKGTDIPSKWVTAHVGWGEGRKHLYIANPESFEFHATKGHAEAAIRKSVTTRGGMVALLRVEGLFEADVKVIQIA